MERTKFCENGRSFTLNMKSNVLRESLLRSLPKSSEEEYKENPTMVSSITSYKH